MVISPGQSAPLSRWMMFVDGENLTFRAQELLSKDGIKPSEGRYWIKDRFIWLPGHRGINIINQGCNRLDFSAVRAYYYTSLVGDEPTLEQVRSKLWDLGFTPRVFKKHKQTEKAKGVDISLTKDMLSHAFNNHYDVGVLIAGDRDYVPLVEEVKHLGKRVLLIFFSEPNGLNPALKLAADDYFDWTPAFTGTWANSNIVKT